MFDTCEKFYKERPSNLIAVTGTNGKSSVAEFYKQIMLMSKKRVATIGTFGIFINNKKISNNLTTPDIITIHKILQKLKKKKIENVMIETSSHGLKQGRLGTIKFMSGVFTNFSRDHLDYHGSMSKYFYSKMILFRKNMKKKGSIILSKQLPELKKIKKITKKNLKLIYSNKYEKTFKKIKFHNLTGDFQISNLAMAFLAAKRCGIKLKKILPKIFQIKSVSGRCELIKTLNFNVKLFVDYAHTPDALEKTLSALKLNYGDNITLVFGCGGERDKEKRPIMGKIANKLSKKIIITDDNPRSENAARIRKQIIKNIKNTKYFNIANRGDAIKFAISSSTPNEIILIAGKGHEINQDYGGFVKKFSDKKFIKSLKVRKKTMIDINQDILKMMKIKTKSGFKKIKIDSRKIKKGDLFLAAKGKKQDGNSFINDAFLKGAALIVSSTKNKRKENIIKVNDILNFLNEFSIQKRNLVNSKIIGITGSSGKTTLKTLLSRTLINYGNTYFSEKSYNNHYGVPLSLSNMPLKAKYCIFELGMSKKGEINALSKMVRPNIGIITNIGEAHLGNFRSISQIAEAKSELLNNISPGGHIILNRDDKYYLFFRKIAYKKRLKVITFGFSRQSNICYEKKTKYHVIVKVHDKRFKLYLKYYNRSNILNLLCCAAVLTALNLDYDKLLKKNRIFELIEGRGKLYRVKRYNKIFNLIDESYNANPSSTSNAIKNFSKIKTRNKKYFVLGDMLELGKRTKNYHKLISREINNSDVDKTFTYGQNTLTTFKHLNKHKKGNILQNLNDLDILMKDIIKDNDYLMVKGSNASGVYKLSKNFISGNKNVV